MKTGALVAILCAVLAFAPSPVLGEDERDPFSSAVLNAMTAQDDLVRSRQYDQLLTAAKKAAESGLPDDYYLLGRAHGTVALVELGKGSDRGFTRHLEAARNAFSRANQVASLLYAPAHVGLARCAQSENDLKTAAKELRKALRITPGYRTASLDLSRVLWQQGLHADAEFAVIQLIQRDAKDMDARMLLGGLKSARKLWSDAESEFRAVLALDPDHDEARRLLASSLMFQQKFQEAAEHFEMYRRQRPKQEESYMMLYHLYQKLGDEGKARQVLNAAVRDLPATVVADRAKNTLEEMNRNPDYFRGEREISPDEILGWLNSADPALVIRAIRKLEDLNESGAIRGLPAEVVRLISPQAARPRVRLHAVRLLGKLGYRGRLTLLEIILFHPRERDPDPRVRREAVVGLSRVESRASVLMLYKALDDPDAKVREAAVQGLAVKTGKWFRKDLSVPCPADQWTAERERYRTWWDRTAHGSSSKRNAARDMSRLVSFYRDMRQARRRMAEYALGVMSDSKEITWWAGYDLFRALTYRDSFHTDAHDLKKQRDRFLVTRECRQWLRAHTELPDTDGGR